MEWAAEMARRHPQVWLDTTNVFGSIEHGAASRHAPACCDKVADLFDAAPDRIFFGTDYPAAMGSLEQLHGQVAGSHVAAGTRWRPNASRFVTEALRGRRVHGLAAQEMKQRKLGQLTVPEMGLGCMGMSAFYGSTDQGEAIATIHRALELGCNFLDTAEIRPTQERGARGQGDAGRRDEWVIATKFGIRFAPTRGPHQPRAGRLG